MLRTTRHISASVLLLGALVSVWFFLNNLQPLAPALYSFTVLCFVGIFLFAKLFAGHFLGRLVTTFVKITKLRYFTLVAISVLVLLGVLARLYFYFKFPYISTSDPGTFYDAAQKIATGQGIHGDNYVAFFPYLAAYDNILGLTMKVISSPWLATILLNTVFDIGAAAITYFLVKKVAKPGSHLPIVAFGVWFLSPFNILFSVISLPIIVVNFFIIATIFIVYLIAKKVVALEAVPALGLASLLGITVGYGNWFRPIFLVTIVALFLLLLYVFLAAEQTKQLAILLSSIFLLVVVIFFGFQTLNIHLVTKEVGMPAASNASGWSIYVGSNQDADGQWNQGDQDNIPTICKNSVSEEDCQGKLQTAGVERYKSYNIGETLSLFVRKLFVFSSRQALMYNANTSIQYYSTSKAAKVMNIYIIAFTTILFALSAIFLYQSAQKVISKEGIAPIVIFASVLMVGLFLSDMFVEASLRYAQIMYPLFIVFAVLALESLVAKARK